MILHLKRKSLNVEIASRFKGASKVTYSKSCCLNNSGGHAILLSLWSLKTSLQRDFSGGGRRLFLWGWITFFILIYGTKEKSVPYRLLYISLCSGGQRCQMSYIGFFYHIQRVFSSYRLKLWVFQYLFHSMWC